MTLRRLAATDLEVHPVSLGGNVFGWTADARESRRVLDAYVAGGGNFIDTADVYSRWVHGNRGGESETIIGGWLAKRGNRDRVVIATKVGWEGGLSAANVRSRAEASLRRLGVEYVDLLYVHADDGVTPPEETVAALNSLVGEGKARHLAASNYSPERLSAAIAASDRLGLAGFAALQAEYSLVERAAYEVALRPTCIDHRLPCIAYFGLARGFLTGKYRPGATEVPTARSKEGLDGSRYLNPVGIRVLATLDSVVAERGVAAATVALAWTLAQPTVAAVTTSARSPDQLADLLDAAVLRLADDELERLDAASGPRGVEDAPATSS